MNLLVLPIYIFLTIQFITGVALLADGIRRAIQGKS
jgi:hypothetical protein